MEVAGSRCGHLPPVCAGAHHHLALLHRAPGRRVPLGTTATKIFWEKRNYMPSFTLCPAYRETTFSVGNNPERENDTLLKFFRDMSPKPKELLRDLETSEYNSSEFASCTSDGCVYFATSYDYRAGEHCITSKATSLDIFDLFLLHHPSYRYRLSADDEIIVTYILVFHGHPDFFGTRLADESTHYITAH